MPTPEYTIACTKNEQITHDVYDIRFEKPEGFTFKAGQFFLLDVPLVNDPTDLQPRAYSIASSPDEDEIILAIKLTPGGRTSQWIEEVLKPGISVIMKGPFGVFQLNSNTEKDYVFICTSTGNAPFRSMILDALSKGDTRRMDLVYGVRSEEDLFWQQELEELAETHENFHVHIALSQPSEHWQGLRGRVQTVTPEVIHNFSNKNIYVCGNPDMTKEVKQLCLEKWGVEKQDFHMEGYI